ncbi:hypothetical protein P3T37_000347 [Kitasatospora sp. MAA4]|uniref:hypothetical protein n=1 Tax=Kitasatospora sp. MAA4 TaxID=3035093 RepID=UPI002475021B|nr:hypothetical protein [Kitasatospora sp. MAA4]MDH6130980.1 hypothetical protein [Kitasatospora sp. MAA4]
MLTSYTYDDGHELRQHAAEQNLNCPPDTELSKLTVDHVLRLSAITAAQPSVIAANQRLLALFAVLPALGDEEDPGFWLEVQRAGDGSLYLAGGNIEGWIRLTFTYPNETALAGNILDAIRTLAAEGRTAVAEVIGKRLFNTDHAAYDGELWLRAVEEAAFAVLMAAKAPSDPEAVKNFRNSWLQG